MYQPRRHLSQMNHTRFYRGKDTLLKKIWTNSGRGRVISSGNAWERRNPIVEKLSERIGTLLKGLRTHYGQHWEPFSAKMH